MVAVVERTAVGIREHVQKALLANRLLAGFQFGIEDAQGTVTLTGAVDCLAQRREAEAAAAGLPGVRHVVNEIGIRYDGVNGLRDFDLLTSAPHVLESHFLLRGKRLHVAFENGHAVLTGRVETLYERAEAERVISLLSCLRGVENRIVVRSPTGEPEAIRADVAESIRRIVGRAADRIEVAVDGQCISLVGAVRTQFERRACIAEVGKVRGITKVIDELCVDDK